MAGLVLQLPAGEILQLPTGELLQLEVAPPVVVPTDANIRHVSTSKKLQTYRLSDSTKSLEFDPINSFRTNDYAITQLDQLSGSPEIVINATEIADNGRSVFALTRFAGLVTDAEYFLEIQYTFENGTTDRDRMRFLGA